MREEQQNIIVLELIKLIIIMVTLIVCAGHYHYWQAYIYGLINIIFVIGINIALKRKNVIVNSNKIYYSKHRDLFWDNWFWMLYWVLYIGIFIVAGIDAGRFARSRQLDFFIYAINLAIYISFYCLMVWAIVTNNSFLVPIGNRNRKDVVTRGPYRLVRHPGYLGGIVLLISTPLLLGSTWAIIPASINVVLLIARTFIEDNILRDSLSDYIGYSREVRFKLLPQIW